MVRDYRNSEEYGTAYEVLVTTGDQVVFEVDVRLLSLYAPTEEPAVEFSAVSPDNKRTPIPLRRVAKRGSDPWLWRWYFKEEPQGPGIIGPGDRIDGGISILNEKGSLYEFVELELTPQDGQVIKQQEPPRLIKALNSTMVRKPAEPTDDAAAVEAIMVHIWNRLSRPMDDAWLGPDGGALGLVHLDDLEAAATANDPSKILRTEDITEERWAREFTEMLLGETYSAFQGLYQGTDNEYYQKIEGKLGDRAYPICAACQHVSTMAVITRGIDVNGIYLNAGHQSATVKYAKWYEGKRTVGQLIGARDDSRNVTGDGAQIDLQPASFFLFCKNKNGPSNQPGDHIGPVLRILRSPLGNRLQLFDTGGMNCTGRNSENGKVPRSPNIYDYGWSERIQGPIVPKNVPDEDKGKSAEEYFTLKGCGTVVRASDLKQGIEQMKNTVPMGLARLLILKEGSLIFATPLLKMNDTGSGSIVRFSIARYLWSLRELPGCGKYTALWQIDIPRSELVNRYLAERALATAPLSQLAHELELQNTARAASPHRFALLDLTSTPTGQVAVERRYDRNTGGFTPTARPAAQANLPADRHTINNGVAEATYEYFDRERDAGYGKKVKLLYFKGDWLHGPETPENPPETE